MTYEALCHMIETKRATLGAMMDAMGEKWDGAKWDAADREIRDLEEQARRLIPARFYTVIIGEKRVYVRVCAPRYNADEADWRRAAARRGIRRLCGGIGWHPRDGHYPWEQDSMWGQVTYAVPWHLGGGLNLGSVTTLTVFRGR